MGDVRVETYANTSLAMVLAVSGAKVNGQKAVKQALAATKRNRCYCPGKRTRQSQAPLSISAHLALTSLSQVL